MLRGKILQIKWDGEFVATVAGVTRKFKDLEAMHDWFSRILSQAKDAKKRGLLMEDLKHMCDFSA